jgi:hypothetical protein
VDKRRICSRVIAAAVVAGVLGAGPPMAASSAAGAAAPPAGGADLARAAWRDVSTGGGALTSAAGGQVQAAVAGDAVTFADPNETADPRADILEVGVGAGDAGGLIFTMAVEQIAAPTSGPAATVALWPVDTSGDAEADVIVAVVRTAAGTNGVVFDAASGVDVCGLSASADAATRIFRAEVFSPGCFGDVRRPAVGGIVVFDDGTGTQRVDSAPDDMTLVRFTRPAPGAPSGGYAIVSRGAGFQRYGAVAPYQCGGTCPIPPPLPLPTVTMNGTFEDYVGPRPVVATTAGRPFDPGLWAVTDDGEVTTQDDAEWFGDATELDLVRPVVGMAVRPDRSGYWLVASDGGIFAYGDAPFFGSTGGIPLQKPIVGMAATPSGEGYWLVASDGGIFAFGDATFHGSMGGQRLNRPVVGMAAGVTEQGYWLVASDGGIFSFGVPFHGSTGGIVLQQPIVGMAATRSGGGYRFIARDGGVFSYGDAEFHGSGAAPGRTDVIGIATA